MTPEEQWRESSDPAAMLTLLRDSASERKLRLFGCACCRRIWPALVQAGSRRPVEMSELFADGQASAEELSRTWVQAQIAWKRVRYPDDPDHVTGDPLPGPDSGTWMDAADAAATLVESPGGGAYDRENTLHAVRSVAEAARRATGQAGEEARGQAAILRDIFTPFRPIALDLAWLTPTVVSLARAAYEERQLSSGELDPHRLAVLADALEEAGSPVEITAHLRGPGPHVRGCHVVDLCLGLS